MKKNFVSTHKKTHKLFVYVRNNSYFCPYIIHTYMNEPTKVLKKMETEVRTSLRSRIATMNEGESILFSLAEVSYSTLMTYSSLLQIQTGNTYKTRLNRRERTLTITRTA